MSEKPGVRMGAAEVVLTTKVPKQLAQALHEAARANCRTVSGEIRALLRDRFLADRAGD